MNKIVFVYEIFLKPIQSDLLFERVDQRLAEHLLQIFGIGF